MCRALFDRDTAPGAEPEDLMRLDIPALIVPGHDAAHATSAARYLEECLPRSDYWDVAVEQQTEANVPKRVMEFLQKRRDSSLYAAIHVFAMRSGASVTSCKRLEREAGHHLPHRKACHRSRRCTARLV